MICVSVAEKNAQNCINALKGIGFAEIRLDKMELGKGDLQRIFSSKKRLIATCRPGKFSEAERHEILLKALEFKPSYIDLEIESSPAFIGKAVAKARDNGVKVIISYHNFNSTPEFEELKKIAESCFDRAADIAKIACKVNLPQDNAKLLGLLSIGKPMVVVGMGEKGKITRIVAPLLGAEFTFASPGQGKETAEGQIPFKELKKSIGGLEKLIGD